MRFLLHSTLLIDHANRDAEAMGLLLSLVEDGHDLFTCDVVTCESLSKGDSNDIRHLETLLDALDYVALTPTAARAAGVARRERRIAGGRRSLGDALIAALANELGATVITRNTSDFARQGVPTLTY